MLKPASDDEQKQSIVNITEAIDEARDAVVNGHAETKSEPNSAAIIITYADGNITTRIAGMVNKNVMYGALIEAVLSIHELDQLNAIAKLQAEYDAFIEKYTTEGRTDN